jgi:hypothetical protein
MPPRETYHTGHEFTARGYDQSRAISYEARALVIHSTENDARPGRPRIQPADIKYIREAAEAPDVLTFLSLV